MRVDLTVNPFEVPPRETAQRLLASYMATVQSSFPFLPEASFNRQVDQYYDSMSIGTHISISTKWLAVLNFVFATGAKYSQLVEQEWPIDDQDDHVYYSRGHSLSSIDGSPLIGKPDLLEIQMTAILAFYFLSVGHVNRAWVVIGHSLRYAYALGLHMRNENRAATILQKEIIARIWWGLYSLEGTISTIVGRPTFLIEDFCSVPLPLPLPIEQILDEAQQNETCEYFSMSSIQVDSVTSQPSNAGSYLRSRVQIGRITQEINIELYSPAVVAKSWKHMQQTMARLYEKLEAWLASLPSGLSFAQTNVDSSFQRERQILQILYIENKILITRPCLCRFDTRIVNQTQAADDFNKRTARICVEAANAMADLLPDCIDVTHLYKMGPWWSVVHNLMQGLVVLLLEMSYNTVHFQEGKEILAPAKKLLRGLRLMATRNQTAERAYAIAFRALKDLASKSNADISDIIWEDTTRTAFLFEAEPAVGEHDPRYSFPAGAPDQVFESQGVYPNSFGGQVGYASMFDPHGTAH
ncbi:hypothetical protein PSPO01_15991 [Paraphaeosphaeria sporulosa]